MTPSVLVGIGGGLAISGATAVALFTSVRYAVWDLGNSALYVAFLIALLALAGSRSFRGRPFAGVIRDVAVAAFLFTAGSLVTYWIATTLLADRIHQLPLFTKDYAYHGYASPQAYLFATGNYAALMRLQVFSATLSFVLQVVVGGIGGWVFGQVARAFTASRTAAARA